MKYWLIGAVVIAVLAGGWLITRNRAATDSANTSEQTPTPVQNEPVVTDPGTTTAEPTEFAPSGTKIVGNYYQYSDADYKAAIAAGRPVFLYFYANWCPTCAQQEPIVQELMREIEDESQLDDMVAFRVNFNDSDTDKSEEALAREFGVTYQHTMFTLDEDGKQVKKLLGQTSKEALRAAFQQAVEA